MFGINLTKPLGLLSRVGRKAISFAKKKIRPLMDEESKTRKRLGRFVNRDIGRAMKSAEGMAMKAQPYIEAYLSGQGGGTLPTANEDPVYNPNEFKPRRVGGWGQDSFDPNATVNELQNAFGSSLRYPRNLLEQQANDIARLTARASAYADSPSDEGRIRYSDPRYPGQFSYEKPLRFY